MSRLSQDEFDGQGILLNGFDYDKQAWVKDGRYLRCGHPESMTCGCFGREHTGEPVRVSVETIELVDWSERFPHETALEIAVRQSTFCLCGKSKNIGQSSCGCKAGL